MYLTNVNPGRSGMSRDFTKFENHWVFLGYGLFFQGLLHQKKQHMPSISRSHQAAPPCLASRQDCWPEYQQVPTRHWEMVKWKVK